MLFYNYGLAKLKHGYLHKQEFGVGFGFSGGGGVAVVVWRCCSGVDVVLRRWSCAAGAEEFRRWSDDAVVLRRCSVLRWRGGSVRCSAAATGSVAASAAAPRAARVLSICCIDGYAARPAALRCAPITAINNEV